MAKLTPEIRKEIMKVLEAMEAAEDTRTARGRVWARIAVNSRTRPDRTRT